MVIALTPENLLKPPYPLVFLFLWSLLRKSMMTYDLFLIFLSLLMNVIMLHKILEFMRADENTLNLFAHGENVMADFFLS